MKTNPREVSKRCVIATILLLGCTGNVADGPGIADAEELLGANVSNCVEAEALCEEADALCLTVSPGRCDSLQKKCAKAREEYCQEGSPCEPATCSAEACGIVEDGCGGTLDCGSCESPCEPATCSAEACGTVEDGCGGTLDCGACESACEPITCAADSCGIVDDGCGGTLDCGTCLSSRPQPPRDGDLGDGAGRFRVGCDFSHQLQVDPIVSPFQASGHMHDFFGNTITSSDPDYNRMLSGGTSCDFSKDTAAYWFPALQAPDGSFVQPEGFQFYYRARPLDYEYGTNYFPPNFMMIAGGHHAPDTAAYWTCKGESDTGYADRKTYIPDCRGVEEEWLVAHVFFPSCWDGVNLDSADHRSHVAYGLDDDGNPSSSHPDTCPASHPYKIPQLDLRVTYPIKDGTGYHFADGHQVPHSDFWNTWQQDALETLIDDCLRTGKNCEGISD